MNFPNGFYDLLVNSNLAHALAENSQGRCAKEHELSPEEASQRCSEYLARIVAEILDELPGESSEQLKKQLELINEILIQLRKKHSTLDDETLVHPLRLLKSIQNTTDQLSVPKSGLAQPYLFTAGRTEPSLLSELRHELNAADEVDVLVSFITHSGVRKMWDILQRASAVDAAGKPRTRFRFLTTTYTGATEAHALDELARLPGAQVRVSLDGRRSRLHAKAWIFKRTTGFGSAYVGSANLSGAAMLGGTEWTVKFTQAGEPDLYRRALANFETLWNDREFQLYDPDQPQQALALRQALKVESGTSENYTRTWFDLVPKDYQREILERLEEERRHGRSRNLVVAATGTGKTVVAAFDYQRICHQNGGRPRLLFVAHREEILRQTRQTFQAVLRDTGFGELLTGATQPLSHDHLFATIDSVTSRKLLETFGGDYWNMIIVDECHRLAAQRFDAFVRAIKPATLLGLTATPERSDGQSILQYFDLRPDGSPAYEMRLWDALDRQLLAPFEYYGCDDNTDYTEVPFDEAGERSALDKILTGNEARAMRVIHEWQRITLEPRRSRALAFCVSVAHAQFMTETFNRAGIPAACVVGETDPEIRRQAPQKLQGGELCVLVTCDLYNEGIDLPMVDTLLFLRPTQSALLFQQQLGRGLRLSEGKACCLVLDFVGRFRTDFRFDRLFSSMTGLTRKQLIEAVESGFHGLPPGCFIQLQPVVRDHVLACLRATALPYWRRLKTELASYAALKGRTNIKMSTFLHDQDLALDDLYREQGESGWTALKRAVGLETQPPTPEEEYFGRRFSSLLHLDDTNYLQTAVRAAEDPATYEAMSATQKLQLQMLNYQIDGQHHQLGDGKRLLERLGAKSPIWAEFIELLRILESKNIHPSRSVPGLEDVPLSLHASYEIREILTAVGWLTSQQRTPFQSGTLPLENRKTELLFVTLDKTQGYHAGISYHDYAISTDLFHWQSQNAAGPETKAGQRYIASDSNGWSFQLFVRENKTRPYRVLGPVILVEYNGAKPMNITWKLAVPLSESLFRAYSVLRA